MNPMRALRQYQNVTAQAQTSEASPHRLVQMLMQGVLDRLAQAKGAIARKDVPGKGLAITRAVALIGGLREGLDMTNSAQQVARVDSLYTYMMTRLTEANIKTDPKIIDEVAGLMITVKEGWDAIAPVA
ncbi:MAG: flagellar export chaperone FliS [Janthinobacterium lividum]|uniref:flagellar export chaperone FliS n=1 Tax=Pseudomonas sp. MWU16-30317 TaxID=2878095 RepID=UPI001CFA95B3|nr:flagellar export chaperone FliS [Pseudomonas sp. MWU16-30317]